MSKVILDAETRAKLKGLNGQLELYDEQGNLLAVCLPPATYRAIAATANPFTEEEIKAAFSQPKTGRPLAEILAELRGRGK